MRTENLRGGVAVACAQKAIEFPAQSLIEFMFPGLCAVRHIHLPMQDMVELDSLTSMTAADRARLQEREKELLGRLSGRITWHVAPIIMLAHSRTNLPAKLRCFLHTLGLLCNSRAELRELCQSVVSMHTDYGTEKALCRVEGVDLDSILPYLHCKGSEPVLEEEMLMGPMPAVEECFALAAAPDHPDADGEGQDDKVSFADTLEGPDMMHIIHNVTANLADILACYSSMMTALKAICSLLAGRETKQQLIETCFSFGPGQAHMDAIQSFQVVPHEKRWNTVATSIEELHDLEGALRMHWNLASFLGHRGEAGAAVPAARPGDGAEGDLGVNLQAADDGISSPYF